MEWKKLLESASCLDDSELEEALSGIDRILKDSLKHGTNSHGLACEPLVRLSMFSVFHLDEERTEQKESRIKEVPKKKGPNTPRYKELANKINAFSSNLPFPLNKNCHKTFTDDTIKGFSSYSSRNRGPYDKFFCSTILLFFIHEIRNGHFNSKFMNKIAPQSDKLFLKRAAKICLDYLQHGIPSNQKDELKETEQMFIVETQNEAVFDLFVRNFSVQYRNNVIKEKIHFIVYRPMRSNPQQLARSFVSVNRPKAELKDKSEFLYRHFFKPPVDHQHMRFSVGKVIPLKDAVYLLGGQRPMQEFNQARPFHSLKVMAINWNDIRLYHSLFPLLVLTTNYNGDIMVSRAAARLTPIDYSKDASLEFVKLPDLEDSLREDAKKEKYWIEQLKNRILRGEPDEERSRQNRELTWIEKYRSDLRSQGQNEEEFEKKLNDRAIGIGDHLHKIFPLTAEDCSFEDIALRISSWANNDPHSVQGWSIPPGFTRHDEEDEIQLTDDLFKSEITKVFGDNNNTPYTNADGEKFDLWTNTRFGPLSLSKIT